MRPCQLTAGKCWKYPGDGTETDLSLSGPEHFIGIVNLLTKLKPVIQNLTQVRFFTTQRRKRNSGGYLGYNQVIFTHRQTKSDRVY